MRTESTATHVPAHHTTQGPTARTSATPAPTPNVQPTDSVHTIMSTTEQLALATRVIQVCEQNIFFCCFFKSMHIRIYAYSYFVISHW